MKINIARQLFLKKFYTAYHENPTGVSVADIILLTDVQTDGQTCHLHKALLFFCEELLIRSV